MIKDDLFRVDDMVEKPEPGTAQANPQLIIGRYILTPDIFELIEQTLNQAKVANLITDALLNKQKQAVYWL